MAKFRFRLATLLRLRQALRDQRREALAEAYRVDELLAVQWARLQQEIDALGAECRRAAGPGTVNVDRLLEAQRYELALKTRQRQLQDQRRQVAEQIEHRRAALAEADRQVRVLEKLRQRQAARHQYEENRREIKLLDEVAQRQFAQGKLP